MVSTWRDERRTKGENMFLAKFKPVLRGLLILFLVAASTSALAGDDHHRGRRLSGSWDASITFGSSVIRALYAFHQGGTLAESDNPGFDPNFGGDALSPGLGAWRRSGRTFVARYRKLAFSPAGALAQVYTTTMNFRLARNGELKGTVSIQVAQPDGTVAANLGPLRFTATRLTP